MSNLIVRAGWLPALAAGALWVVLAAHGEEPAAGGSPPPSPAMPSSGQAGVRFALAAEGLPDPASDKVHWRSTPLLADFNADGQLDLAAYGRYADGAYVWLGDGKGHWREARQGLPRLKEGGEVESACGGGLDAGDVNRDGHLDLAVADRCTGVFVYLGDGQGHWQVATERLTTAKAQDETVEETERGYYRGAEDLALGDVNGDGVLDIVTIADDHGGFTVYFGDGSGKAWQESLGDDGLPSTGDEDPTLGFTGGRGNEVILRDMNSDGHLDVIATHLWGPRVWLGDGKGRWKKASEGLPKPVIGGIFDAVTVADFNEDGRLDLAVSNVVDGPTVFLQNADGTWQATPDVMPGMRGGAGAVAAGDVNQDGHADLVVGGRLNHEFKRDDFGLFVLLGDGRGGWTPHPAGLPEMVLPLIWGITLGDVNKDGRPDLAVTAGGSSRPSLFHPRKKKAHKDKDNPPPQDAKPAQPEPKLPKVQVWLNQSPPPDSGPPAKPGE